MKQGNIREYLADDESLQFSRIGRLHGGTTDDAIIGATDRRLVFLKDREVFKDVSYDHVRSIESNRTTRFDLEGIDYRAVLGSGGAIALLSFVAAIGASSGALAFLLVLAAVAGVGLIEYGWKHREDYDGFETVKRPVQTISITTGDGRTERIEVPVEQSMDVELSRLIRSEN